ncbi:AcrR family transcriptional regulator [Kitasatospora sp. GP30]|uniref:TetR/AcrR family transcriptional regulator n=1 Tax=Kitasatospora sp. GP30 TaxID=3035084 RepID=UPI000CAB9AF1|nr:TetR/AcrR family transcriptional regulator [Kitasatospora sp. GP30]MDH6138540.1 AcrR family transcriptional regulator [Kitasatospora sp. GP30]
MTAETTPASKPPVTEERPKRRQARGERRIAQLLEAAGQVFAESGYAATTTNAIAARAGVSPGSLYQYFPNKDAIAAALAEYYADSLDELLAPFAVVDPTSVTLDQALGASLEPIVAFHRKNPACLVLFIGGNAPGHVMDLQAPLMVSTHARIQALLTLYAPDLPEARLQLGAAVTLAAYKGVLPLLVEAEEEQVPALREQLKSLLLGYFDRLLTGAPDQVDARHGRVRPPEPKVSTNSPQ